MKADKTQTHLSRRDHEILGIIYRNGKTTFQELFMRITDGTDEQALKKKLDELEIKGYVQCGYYNKQRIYSPPALPGSEQERVRLSPFKQLVQAFFAQSSEQAVQFSLPEYDLTDEDLQKIIQKIEKARKEGR